MSDDFITKEQFEVLDGTFDLKVYVKKLERNLGIDFTNKKFEDKSATLKCKKGAKLILANQEYIFDKRVNIEIKGDNINIKLLSMT